MISIRAQGDGMKTGSFQISEALSRFPPGGCPCRVCDQRGLQASFRGMANQDPKFSWIKQGFTAGEHDCSDSRLVCFLDESLGP
jgi:hypothetical protein